MSVSDPRDRFGYYGRLYAGLWDRYVERGVDATRDPNDKENVSESDWHHKHYLDVGYDAMRIVLQSLIAGGREPPRKILDFPSGSGRVTRHLKAMFPESMIGACDLYEEHVVFCERQFGTVSVPSKENLAELDVGEWDLIFCGSLLTHLPEYLFWPAIRFMVRSLSPSGMAIVTLEGRHALHIQDHKWKFLDDRLFDVARAQFLERGFGFVDYDHQFLTSSFSKQENYGVTLTSAEWLMKGLTAMEDIRVVSFTERDWDDHQDTVVFCKPGVNK